MRVEVKSEWTAETLHDRYRHTQDPVERPHWHILWLLKADKSPREVAVLLGYTARWVRMIISRWNAQGAAEIRDHRYAIAEAKPLLSLEQQAELAEALQQPPAEGGL